MDSHPVSVLEPQLVDPSDMPESRWRLTLDIVAVLLFVGASYSIWEIVSLTAVHDKDGGLLLWIGGAVVSLVLMALVLMAEARLSERMNLRALYMDQIDRLREPLVRSQGALTLIGDRNHSALAVFDRRSRFWYVNDKAAETIGQPRIVIEGHQPSAVLAPDLAKKMEMRVAEARAQDTPLLLVETEIDPVTGETRFMQWSYETVTGAGEMNGFVVLRIEDVTSLVVARERKEQMFRQVIDTLVAVVDRRDPYASGHSSRVGQLSKVIAEEMGLDSVSVDTAQIAGSLMNFGKVLVSRRILTKTTALDAQELQRVRDSILTSADILAIINFEGPVVQTLRQVLEHIDGTGEPEGLKGDEILLPARIVAVANAFVAFVSPRAHREGLPFHDALAALSRDSGRLYDEHVLIALTHYIENRPNKLDWLTVTKQSSQQNASV